MPRHYHVLVAVAIALIATWEVRAQPKPVPVLQTVPLPYEQISFQRDGQEITRYHFGSALKRSFVYPVIGPAGRSLTRMGHPHDPVGHSHHNSIWVSHNDVNGTSFWTDRGKNTGQIIHQRIEKMTDGNTEAFVTAVNAWIDDASKKTLLLERRRIDIVLLDKGEWFMILDLELEAKLDVTFGKTPFGLVAVRMAKTIGVHDGGGTIRNSAGQVNEREVFWKPAKWVDYSGAITPKAVEGITLMDHPGNVNHPSVYHVRNDGWMGSSLTFHDALKLGAGKSLRLRYGFYIHAGQPSVAAIENRWAEFAKTTIDELKPKKK